MGEVLAGKSNFKETQPDYQPPGELAATRTSLLRSGLGVRPAMLAVAAAHALGSDCNSDINADTRAHIHGQTEHDIEADPDGRCLRIPTDSAETRAKGAEDPFRSTSDFAVRVV